MNKHLLKLSIIGLLALGGLIVYQTVGFSIVGTQSSPETLDEKNRKQSKRNGKDAEKPAIKVETRSYTSVQRLDEATQTEDFVSSTESGTRYVVVGQFPDDFGEVRSADRKKRLFRQILLPQIKVENRRILKNRRWLASLVDGFDTESLSDTEQRRSHTLLARYEVIDGERHNWEITKDHLNTLLHRVHVIPSSLVLAQAANESAWGTSRFCLEANNIFGEWTYNKSEGLKPEGVDESAPHRVKIFPDIRSSLRSYMLNLNTHNAYASFREIRMENEDTLNSLELVKGLEQYSSRREEYVESISNLIRYNDYRQYDKF